MAAPVGNQNAKKGKAWEQALKRGLARWTGESVDAGLDRLADRMIRAAMTDDDAAAAMIIERIGDRLDGKPATIIAGSDEHPPVAVTGIGMIPLQSDTKRTVSE